MRWWVWVWVTVWACVHFRMWKCGPQCRTHIEHHGGEVTMQDEKPYQNRKIERLHEKISRAARANTFYNFPTINLFIWLDGELSLKMGGATNPCTPSVLRLVHSAIIRATSHSVRSTLFTSLFIFFSFYFFIFLFAARFIGVFPKQQHVRVCVCFVVVCEWYAKREMFACVCVCRSSFHSILRSLRSASNCVTLTAHTHTLRIWFVFCVLLRSMSWSRETSFSFEATVQTFRRAFHSLALRHSWIKLNLFFLCVCVCFHRKQFSNKKFLVQRNPQRSAKFEREKIFAAVFSIRCHISNQFVFVRICFSFNLFCFFFSNFEIEMQTTIPMNYSICSGRIIKAKKSINSIEN